MVAVDGPIATLDIAPELLAEFGAIIGKLVSVVGSAECDGAVRLKVRVPDGLGPMVQVTVTKRSSAPYDFVFSLVDAR